MGQSTDAYLFYGIEAGDETAPADIAEQLGMTLAEDDWEPWKTLLPEGIKVDTHCSGEYPIHFICIEATYKTAWRGSVTKFDYLPDVEKDFPELVALLKVYADKLGWDAPSWMIASNWN